MLTFSASKYEIRFDTNFTLINDEDEWDNLDQILEDDLVSGSLNPVPATELVSVVVNMSTFGESDQLYYVAMQGFDDQQGSEISNLVSFGIIPPGQVEDLSALLDESVVILNFKSPGDDGMRGIGKEILYQSDSLPNLSCCSFSI